MRGHWMILDKWVWHENEEHMAKAWAKDQKAGYQDGAQVRTFRRTVRAGGATVPVIVGVVRREIIRP